LVLGSFVNNARTKSLNEHDRDEFYEECSKAFTILKSATSLGAHISTDLIDVRTLEPECRAHFQAEMANFEKQLEGFLVEFPSEAAMKKFSASFDNFRAISENFSDSNVIEEAKTRRDTVDRKFRACLASYSASRLLVEGSDDDIIGNLISLKSASLSVSQYKDLIDNEMDIHLAAVKKECGPQRIGILGLKLNEHANKTISRMIINETKSLKGYSLMLRNEKTLRMSYEAVLDLLRGDELDENCRHGLKAHYEAFEEEYWHLVQKGLLSLQDTLLDLPIQTRQFPRLECSVYEKIRHIMTHVCAYWTLDSVHSSGSGGKGDGKDSLSDKSNLLQPHAAQIIAVFRLLGVENEDDVGEALAESFIDKESSTDIEGYITGLKKQLAQVFTGEGKSLILAMVSIVLAVLGCSVKCACYR